MRVRLETIANARSGDKGDASNVGLIADTDAAYELLRREATAERVKQHFQGVCRGPVERFEVPNLRAFNFLLHDSLGGGGTESLKTDAQGKTHAQGLLAMEIDVPEALLPPPGGPMDRAPMPHPPANLDPQSSATAVPGDPAARLTNPIHPGSPATAAAGHDDTEEDDDDSSPTGDAATRRT